VNIDAITGAWHVSNIAIDLIATFPVAGAIGFETQEKSFRYALFAFLSLMARSQKNNDSQL
jgi:hypothetical protein